MEPNPWNRPLRGITAGFICVTLACLSGCGWRMAEWSERPETTVWSDDGQQLAVVRYDFGLKWVESGSGLPERSQEESSVYTVSPLAPGDLRPLATSIPGQITHLYFMRSEGYLLVRRMVNQSPQGGTVAYVSFDKMTLDGKLEEITRSPMSDGVGCVVVDDIELDTATREEVIIPSPDGKTLAWLQTRHGCGVFERTLQFIDAADLRPLGPPVSLDEALDGFTDSGVLKTGWDVRGRLLVTRAAGVSFPAWAFVPDQEPVFLPAMGWACFSPVTTSSWISLEGYGARMTRAGNLTITTEPLGGVFGCQQIAGL